MMRESYIENKICTKAKALGWLVFKFVSPGNSGVPDRILLKEGYAMFIEFKAPGKVSTPIQLRQQQRLRNAGFRVVVIDSIDAGEAFLAAL